MSNKREAIDLLSSDNEDVFETNENEKKKNKKNEGCNRKWKPFYLNHLKHLSHNDTSNQTSLKLQDIFSEDLYEIETIILFNFMYDFEFLLKRCPILENKKVLCLYGGQIDREISIAGLSFKLAKVLIGDPYGSFHAKGGLIFYKDVGVRIFFSTANFLESDYDWMTQGHFVQDFPLLELNERKDLIPRFEKDLVKFLKAIRLENSKKNEKLELQNSINSLALYNFNSAQISIIASVEGRYKGNDYGHLKIKKELENSTIPHNFINKKSSIVCQFSSFANVSSGKKIENQTSHIREIVNSMNPSKLDSDIEIVWPTAEMIRNSEQAVGGSLPSKKSCLFYGTNLENPKQELFKLLRHWDGTISKRQKYPPHMKCFFRYLSNNQSSSSSSSSSSSNNNNNIELAWFLLTSSNISKASHGTLEKNGTQLYMKNFEIGVLFIPDKITNCYRDFSCTPNHELLGIDIDIPDKHECKNKVFISSILPMNNDNIIPFPIPFQLPPRKYSDNDKPWLSSMN